MRTSAASRPDPVAWPVGLMIVAASIPLVGVLNLASAARNFDPDLYLKQLLWAVAGAAIAFLISRLKPATLELIAWPAYVVTCVLLVLVLAIGTPIKGAQRWLDLGPVNMQPSELAKVSIMLVVARYFGRWEMPGGYTLLALLRPMNPSRAFALAAFAGWRWYHQRHAISKAFKKAGLLAPSWHDAIREAEALAQPPPKVAEALADVDPAWVLPAMLAASVVYLLVTLVWMQRTRIDHRRIIAPIDVVMLPFILVLIEPDLGTASIVLAVAASQILFCGMRLRDLIFSFVGAIGTAVLAWNFVLHDYQKKRVQTFLDPESDIQGSGYHAAQSIIAVGSGQLSGKGWGEGTQTQLSFLPENHTDFAFSVLGEEWGFVGTVLVIALFFALVTLMLRAAGRATDRFSALLAVGAAAMIFWHAFINIGMVIGVLPVVGVTLPLVSYGGSSMVTKVIAIGFAVNAVVQRKKA